MANKRSTPARGHPARAKAVPIKAVPNKPVLAERPPPRPAATSFPGAPDDDFLAQRLPLLAPPIELEMQLDAPARRRIQRHPELAPGHPGALLREIVVPGTGRSKSEIARLLGVSRQTLHDVLAERAVVTPQIAVRLGKLFGDGPEPWLRMQAAYDVWRLSRELADVLEAIPTLAAAE